MVAQADLVLVVEPLLVVLGARCVEDPLAEALAHRGQVVADRLAVALAGEGAEQVRVRPDESVPGVEDCLDAVLQDVVREPQVLDVLVAEQDGLLFDEKILALYARGMTVRDIQSHLEELYGVDVSPDLISRATSAVMEDVIAWQSRPLEGVYPIVYLDALFVKVRDQGVVRNKSIYLAIGVTVYGSREVLGIWIEQTEGASSG